MLAFYNMRRRAVLGASPNAAHVALAHLEAHFPGRVTTITQNVDNLHERAGTSGLIHMHGEILKTRCQHCGGTEPAAAELAPDRPCGSCGRAGGLRPDVVWFGETPYGMERIRVALASCDLFISIGTSGSVYPAAGFAAQARALGAHTVELNLEPSRRSAVFGEAVHGRATEVVPGYVAGLLGT